MTVSPSSSKLEILKAKSGMPVWMLCINLRNSRFPTGWGAGPLNSKSSAAPARSMSLYCRLSRLSGLSSQDRYYSQQHKLLSSLSTYLHRGQEHVHHTEESFSW